MTRDEITKLIREEVARALLHAASAVTRMDEDPRRDRPKRLAGPADLQEMAHEIAGRLPEPISAEGLTELERGAMERIARLRSMPKPIRKPKTPKGGS